MNKENEKILEVVDLYTSFNVPAGEVRSVNGVNFSVNKGRVLGIVGESGSGKSVTAYSIMQILQNPGRIVSGSIKFKGKELIGLSNKEMGKIRGEKISIIFQDPMSSLNPVYTIGNQMKEAIRLHPVMRIQKGLDEKINKAKKDYQNALEIYKTNKSEKNKNLVKQTKEKYIEAKYNKDNYAHNRALEMLKLVGINEPEKRLKQYPFEFSGGMLQRIMIAMSLVCEPDLLIADEPTTALDVTIQAQILELLKDIQKKMGMAIIIITHDLGVVAQICDEVDVMYAGRIVERGTVREIFYNPKHEYTKGLMKSIPQADDNNEKLIPIEGNPVDVFCLPKGCSFAPRCSSCMKICLKKYPKPLAVNKEHVTSCFKYILEAYKGKKISKEEFKSLIYHSNEGTASFTPISRLDVLDAYNDYSLMVKQYKASNKKDNEALKYKIKESKNNYKRAKYDLKNAEKSRKISRRELPSMERGDMAHKIKEAKTAVLYTDDKKMNKEQLYKYLQNLNISSYPVDYSFHREDVTIAEREYLIAKTFVKGLDNKDKLTKEKVLCEIENAKVNYENAIDKYERNRRVTRKLLKVRVKLIKINAKRVKKLINKNINYALENFKNDYHGYKSRDDLLKYIDKVNYGTWNFDKTLNNKKLKTLYSVWAKKQSEIYSIREKSNHEHIDALIQEKNQAMYEYYFAKYDYDISIFYNKQKDKFLRELMKLNRKLDRGRKDE